MEAWPFAGLLYSFGSSAPLPGIMTEEPLVRRFYLEANSHREPWASEAWARYPTYLEDCPTTRLRKEAQRLHYMARAEKSPGELTPGPPSY